MEWPVRAHCCGLDSVQQIKRAEASQKGSTRAWQETTPKSVQRERWIMRRGINVKEWGRKKNYDAEEIEEAKCIQRRQWGGLGHKQTHREQQAQSCCLPKLAQPFAASARQHVISAALLCLEPAVNGAVHAHVMKGRSPERYLMQLPSHILYSPPCQSISASCRPH